MTSDESSSKVVGASSTFPVGARRENRLRSASAGRRLSWVAGLAVLLLLAGVFALVAKLFGAF